MRDSWETRDAPVPLDSFLRSLGVMLERTFQAHVESKGGAVFALKGAGYRSIELRVQPKGDHMYVIYAQFSEPEDKVAPRKWKWWGKEEPKEPWYEALEGEDVPLQGGELTEDKLIRYVAPLARGGAMEGPIHCAFRLDKDNIYKFVETLKKVYDFAEDNIGGRRTREHTFPMRIGDRAWDNQNPY